MATKLEHIYALKSILANDATPSDDFEFLDEEIYHHLNNVRASEVRRYLDQNRPISDMVYQYFCMNLSPSKFHDCSCIQNEYGCSILKTNNKIPGYLVDSNGKPFIEVRLPNGEIIDMTSLENFEKSKYSRTNKNTINWFLYNNYIYVTNTMYLEYIIVKEIAENPDDIASMLSCSDVGANCVTLEDYPVDGSMVQNIYIRVLDLLKTKYSYPRDEENDAKSPRTV